MESMRPSEVWVSIVGAFAATLLASFFSLTLLEVDETPLILASTGASAMLLFALPHAAVSQPWNLVGGHLVSALVGVSCAKLIPFELLAAASTIPVAMIAMHYLRCMHPPGGATAITAVVGGISVQDMGYAFVVMPVFFNAIIILSIAMAAGTLRESNPFEVHGGSAQEDS
ncbi:MAG: HPP family protein [Halioglobus sp.]